MIAMSTTIVELMTSWRVGQATLRISPRTSEKKCIGDTRSRCFACAGAVLRSGARGLSEPCFAIMRLVCRCTERDLSGSLERGGLVQVGPEERGAIRGYPAGQEGLEPPTVGFGDR